MTQHGFTTLNWRKSSYTSSGGGQCVELAPFAPAVVVRDSKDPDGPKLMFDAAAWAAFSSEVKEGRLDLA
ncbi:DUF397 domain-containing protein [Spirillospora sp. NPDC052269]